MMFMAAIGCVVLFGLLVWGLRVDVEIVPHEHSIPRRAASFALRRAGRARSRTSTLIEPATKLRVAMSRCDDAAIPPHVWRRAQRPPEALSREELN